MKNLTILKSKIKELITLIEDYKNSNIEDIALYFKIIDDISYKTVRSERVYSYEGEGYVALPLGLFRVKGHKPKGNMHEITREGYILVEEVEAEEISFHLPMSPTVTEVERQLAKTKSLLETAEKLDKEMAKKISHISKCEISFGTFGYNTGYGGIISEAHYFVRDGEISVFAGALGSSMKPQVIKNLQILQEIEYQSPKWNSVFGDATPHELSRFLNVLRNIHVPRYTPPGV